MTKDFTVALKSGLEVGKILAVFHCAESIIDAQVETFRPEVVVVKGKADVKRNYVVGGQIITRPEMAPAFDKAQIAADGIEVVTLSGLPDPCHIVYEGPGFKEEGEVIGGVAEFDTTAPGPHTVKVTAWPYMDWEGGFDGNEV